MDVPFYTLPTRYENSGCFISLPLKWLYFIVVLFGISLITNDVDHFFHVLIGHAYVCFCDVSTQIFALPPPFLVVFRSSLHIANIKPFVSYIFCENVLPLSDLAIDFLIVSFGEQKF